MLTTSSISSTILERAGGYTPQPDSPCCTPVSEVFDVVRNITAVRSGLLHGRTGSGLQDLRKPDLRARVKPQVM